MKKQLISILTVMSMTATALLSGCGSAPAPAAQEGAPSGEAATSSVETAPAANKKPKIALLLPGMLGDKSFLDSAANGMQTLMDEGFEVKTVEMGLDETKWVPTMTDISEQDYDIIVTGPWAVEDALWEVAPQFPDKKYLLFDTEFEQGNPDNVCSIMYSQNQIAFLTGALAAKVEASSMPLVKNTGTIGFVGGMDIPVINDFMVNYIKGAQYVNPDIKVAVSFVGDFVDSATGKELALSQFNNQNVDVLFQCASQSGLGCLEAAKELNKYAIGVDEDQAEIFKDSDPELASHVITSALKRVGDSIVAAVHEDIETGIPWGKSVTYGLESNAIGFAKNDIYESTVPQDIKDYMVELQDQVVAGKVELVSAFGMTADEVETIKNSAKP